MGIMKRLIREGTKDGIEGLNVHSCMEQTYLLLESGQAVSHCNEKATDVTTEDRTYIPGRNKRFLFQNVERGSEDHPASSIVDTGKPLPEGNVAVA